jgi:hypothetical protein
MSLFKELLVYAVIYSPTTQIIPPTLGPSDTSSNNSDPLLLRLLLQSYLRHPAPSTLPPILPPTPCPFDSSSNPTSNTLPLRLFLQSYLQHPAPSTLPPITSPTPFLSTPSPIIPTTPCPYDLSSNHTSDTLPKTPSPNIYHTSDPSPFNQYPTPC